MARRLLSMRQMSQSRHSRHQFASPLGRRSRVRKLLVPVLCVQAAHHRRSHYDRGRELPRSLLYMSGVFQQDRGTRFRKNKSRDLLHGMCRFVLLVQSTKISASSPATTNGWQGVGAMRKPNRERRSRRRRGKRPNLLPNQIRPQ